MDHQVDTYVEKPQASLEEQAKAAGIDVGPNRKFAEITKGVEYIPGDGSEADGTQAPGKSTGLPSKFKDVDSLVRAYEALESKLGKPKDAPTESQAPAKQDFSAFVNEYAETGELSAESRQKISEVIPENLIDGFIQGQSALRQRAAEEVTRDVGGPEVLNSAIEWARNNLSEAETAAYNRAVAQDVATAKLAVSGLVARYQASAGRQGRLISGTATPGGQDRYENWEQFVEALHNPKYKSDPAYRKAVEARLERSQL
jgi:hypothetical protein